MNFINVIKQKQKDWRGYRQPTIAFLGDSVTHGCFDLYVEEGIIHTYMEMDNAYHEKVKKILNIFYPTVPITIVNAGISGDVASAGIKRIDRDVLSYSPDVVVVCYGLNDSGSEENGIDTYVAALKEIFDAVREKGKEVIFLTPNHITERNNIKSLYEEINTTTEAILEKKQNEWLKKYIEAARTLCENEKIPVCDCNKLWDMLSDNDVDINSLLSNRINHPTEEMHWMFAYELVRTMFEK